MMQFSELALQPLDPDGEGQPQRKSFSTDRKASSLGAERGRPEARASKTKVWTEDVDAVWHPFPRHAMLEPSSWTGGQRAQAAHSADGVGKVHGKSLGWPLFPGVVLALTGSRPALPPLQFPPIRREGETRTAWQWRLTVLAPEVSTPQRNAWAGWAPPTLSKPQLFISPWPGLGRVSRGGESSYLSSASAWRVQVSGPRSMAFATTPCV